MTQPPELRWWSVPGWPLAVWVVLQLLTLAIAAAQVPLSDEFPRPAERLAIQQMALVQVVTAALLLPWLCRTPGGAIAAIAVVWPMLQLAGILSVSSGSNMVATATYVSAWLLGLALWRWALPERGQMLALAGALLASLGGVVLWYVHAEFEGMGRVNWEVHGAWGTVMGAVGITHFGWQLAGPWWVMALFLILSGALAGGAAWLRTRMRHAALPAAQEGQMGLTA